MDNTKVISLTEDKVWQTTYEGKEAFCKKTKQREVENLINANIFLDEKIMTLDDIDYSIKTPEIYNWSDNESKVIMEFCKGNNLELMIRNSITREKGVQYTNELLAFFIQNNFYWNDFAPRNIVVSENTIYIFDFERGFTIDKNVDLKNYLRENVFEEYAAFLKPNERFISTSEVFSVMSHEDREISFEDIKSNRVKSILTKQGIENGLSYSTYAKVLEMIVTAEEPIVNEDGEIEYPIVYLEELKDSAGYDIYADEVLKLQSNVGKGAVEL